VHTAELVASLRDFIRQVLDLDPVPPDLPTPRQGPTRPSPSGRGGGRDVRVTATAPAEKPEAAWGVVPPPAAQRSVSAVQAPARRMLSIETSARKHGRVRASNRRRVPLQFQRGCSSSTIMMNTQ
jgi:hypothetical protein